MVLRRPSLFLLAIISGVAMSSPATAGKSDDQRPVWLDVQSSDGRAVISVLGRWHDLLHVRWELDIEGSSKILNRSQATVSATSEPVTLSRATIDDRHSWSARLTVTTETGQHYALVQKNSK